MISNQEQSEKLIYRYYNGTREELRELTEELIAEDFTLHDLLLSQPVRGRDSLGVWRVTSIYSTNPLTGRSFAVAVLSSVHESATRVLSLLRYSGQCGRYSDAHRRRDADDLSM